MTIEEFILNNMDETFWGVILGAVVTPASTSLSNHAAFKRLKFEIKNINENKEEQRIFDFKKELYIELLTEIQRISEYYLQLPKLQQSNPPKFSSEIISRVSLIASEKVLKAVTKLGTDIIENSLKITSMVEAFHDQLKKESIEYQEGGFLGQEDADTNTQKLRKKLELYQIFQKELSQLCLDAYKKLNLSKTQLSMILRNELGSETNFSFDPDNQALERKIDIQLENLFIKSEVSKDKTS